MKVKGSKAPSGAYSMEPQPNKPGYAMMRFYENVEEYTDDDFTGWQWDEYSVLVLNRDGLAAEVENNLAFWVQLAKDAEASAIEREARRIEHEQKEVALVPDVDNLKGVTNALLGVSE